MCNPQPSSCPDGELHHDTIIPAIAIIVAIIVTTVIIMSIATTNIFCSTEITALPSSFCFPSLGRCLRRV